MNAFFLIAAFLSYFVALAHSLRGEWVGKRTLVRAITELRLFDEDQKDEMSKRVLRVAWHVTSITWLGIGSILFYFAFADINSTIVVAARIISVAFFGSFIFSVVTVRGKHPSWVFFLLISVFTWLGSI